MPRHYPTHLPLGRRMAELGYTAQDFSAVTGIHSRTLTEYLAGRTTPLPHHLVTMADVLGVEASELTPDL